MTLDQLKQELKILKIPDVWYSFESRTRPDTYVLDSFHGIWECFYVDERGGANSVKRFHNESDACEYFLNKIRKLLKTWDTGGHGGHGDGAGHEDRGTVRNH